MRSGLRVLTTICALACGGVARAEPTGDPSGWLQRFTQAALKSDTDAIVDTIKEISDPRLSMEGIRSIVQGTVNIMKDETPEYSEQFGDKRVGTFIRRVDVAVRYSKNFMFYSVVLARGEKGWQLVQFNIDGNLNKILDVPWPG